MIAMPYRCYDDGDDYALLLLWRVYLAVAMMTTPACCYDDTSVCCYDDTLVCCYDEHHTRLLL